MWCSQCVWPPDASQLAPNSSSSAAYYYPSGTAGYGGATGYAGSSAGTNDGTYGGTSAYGSSAPVYGSSHGHSHGGAGGPGSRNVTPSGAGVEAPSPYGSSSSLHPALTPTTCATTTAHHVYNGYSTGNTQPSIPALYNSVSSYDHSLSSHQQHSTATTGNSYSWVGFRNQWSKNKLPILIWYWNFKNVGTDVFEFSSVRGSVGFLGSISKSITW